MIKKKLKSIFMMLIMLVNMIGEGAVFAAQNKRGGNKKTVDNGIYVIESLVGEGKVLDICGAEKTDGAKLHIWDESKNSLNQVFYIDKNEDGSYAIESLHAEMFLGTKDKNRDVKQFNPSFKENYKWEINLKNDDEYELKLKSNKLSLDVSGGKSQNGTKLQLWESNNTNAQRFRLHKIGIKDTSLIDELHKKMVLRREQSKLEALSLESKIDKITKYMVSHFEKLKIVHISQEVGKIEKGAFEDCKSIETVLCSPKMLKGFDKSKIKTLVILDGIKKLEKKDFHGLENLENIALPESVEKIEKGTFDNFKNIKELKCDPKWFEYFNRTKIEELEKLRAEIIKDNGIKDNENIQNQIDYFKEKIEILENRLAELGVTQDKKNANNNEKLEGIEQLKKLEKETEELLAKYINKCKENEEKLYRQIIENGVETALKNGKYKTEELVFENNKKVESQTTIEGIVKSDAQNKKYVKYAKEILKNLERNNIKENNSQKKSLDNISEKISYIFKKIKDTYGIKPYPVQVMTVLRLSDEILNGKNTIAEVKTGEGIGAIKVWSQGRYRNINRGTCQKRQRKSKKIL
ncbi:MAG: RICIN domain-containing protein [Clostridia bacterium]|nr:RICIN domain-containing protein [Clostridia bacterium]